MNSKERVIRTLAFNFPDRIPVDSWCMPSAIYKYGQPLKDALELYAFDICYPVFDNVVMGDARFEPGLYTDGWGCVWSNLKKGIIGEVKHHPLEDYGKLDSYRAPTELLKYGWEKVDSSIKANSHKFIFAPWAIDMFERMQALRGVENLFIDLMEETEEFFRLRDIVFGFYREWVRRWLERDIDAIVFSDDWGTQNALIASPVKFRRIFKPMYRELINMAKAKGRYVFFHSDGNITEIMDDFIELGVDAVNIQVWCMDAEELSRRYRGRLTFWGEINRQTTLSYGTVEDIRNEASRLKELFMKNGGGLIGNAAPGDDSPLANIIESLKCWNR